MWYMANSLGGDWGGRSGLGYGGPPTRGIEGISSQF